MLKRCPLKWTFLRLCSGQVKICQISSVSSERTSRFLSNFFIPLQFHERLLLCTFIAFSSNNIYFAQKEPIKAKIFEIFECTGQNLSNYLCQFLNNKSSRLQILYPPPPQTPSVSWKITPLYFFSLSNIYFVQKEDIKMKIF